jgi:methyl-accepting chemotaxis protein
MRATAAATSPDVSPRPASDPSAAAPASLDFGNRVAQLGVQMADINGAIADLVSLNGEVLKTLSGVVEAVDDNTDANRTIAERMETALQAAGEAQSSFGKSAEHIGDTLNSTIGHVEELGDCVIEVASSIRRIKENVANVLKTSADIQQIARETQLIAINAGVEAARSGEAGPGFAVIAKAMKQLADQVGRFALDNTNNLTALQGVLEAMLETANRGNEKAQSALKAQNSARSSAQQISELMRGVETLTGSIGAMADAVQRNADSADRVRSYVNDLSATMDKANKQLSATQVRSDAVVDIGESLMLFIVENGFKTADSPIIELCQKTARRIEELFESAVKAGDIRAGDLFDEKYVPIPGSNPAQVTTRFTAFTDQVLPPIQEAVVKLSPKITFCAAVDRNGYLPTHNLVYSKPQGPDPVWNAANCRNRRIFNDRTGLAAGRNTRPFLLQTYRRDMGGGNFVVMKDISAPIYVDGRHWGGFRMGVKV